MSGSGARIEEDDGRQVLLVDDVIQSVSPEDALTWGSYWAAMVPPFAPRNALILGLGGATLPHLIAHRWGHGGRLVGVDDDPEILHVATAAGWMVVPGLRTVQANAFTFVRTTEERFDYVGVDLYRGGTLPPRTLGRAFLRRVASLLDPPSWLAMNLYAVASSPWRMAHLHEVFQVQREIRVGDNLVVHAKPRVR